MSETGEYMVLQPGSVLGKVLARPGVIMRLHPLNPFGIVVEEPRGKLSQGLRPDKSVFNVFVRPGDSFIIWTIRGDPGTLWMCFIIPIVDILMFIFLFQAEFVVI